MRTKQGTVTSASMQNTVTVTVSRYIVHPVYKKRYPVSKKFLADTNNFEVSEGDVVVIGECSPISKRKHFKVMEVVQRGITKGESVEKEMRELSGKEKEAEEDVNITQLQS